MKDIGVVYHLHGWMVSYTESRVSFAQISSRKRQRKHETGIKDGF